MENNRHNQNRAMNEIGDRFQALGIESDDARVSNNYGNYSNQTFLYNNNHRTTTASSNMRLNPNAQEFVPRQEAPAQYQNPVYAIPTVWGQFQSPHMYIPPIPQQQQQPLPAHHLNGNASSNGAMRHRPAAPKQSESEIEEYLSLSYLKDFIHNIKTYPNSYDRGIKQVTEIISYFLEEDDCIPELMVNQIVDQSIIEAEFRYHGVKLCHHFMMNLRPAKSGQTFKEQIFKRCQRECSREVTKTTTENTFNHLRGLALFIADLYARCEEPEMGQHLPKLLLNLLSGNNNSKANENIKVVCQVLKLCGQQLVKSAIKNKETLDKVLDVLRAKDNGDLTPSMKTMVTYVTKLAENGWVAPQVAANTNRVNPYLNMNNNPQMALPHGAMPGADNYGMYDFGDCGDERNEDVVRCFEQFINNNDVGDQPNSDNAP